MAYTQVSLNDLSSQLGVLLDDATASYWIQEEKLFAIIEALRIWGATTSYWRSRGTFNITPATPWYDLSVQLPTLRPRVWTLNSMVRQMQFMCLEAPSFTGAGGSGQISISSILQAIQRARDQFVIDVQFPYTIHPPADFSVIAPDGLVQIPDTTVYLHRLTFQDSTSGAYSNLWREDAWATDHNNQLWTLEPGTPLAFSQSENSPLTVQLVPAPVNAGGLEAVTVDSLQMDLTNPNATFGIPDEWVYGIQYAALADIFSAGQSDDPVRFTYCTTRYEQIVEAARLARSVIRLQLNGVPLPVDTLAAIDAGNPYWRNQPAKPQMAGVLYDLIAVANIPDTGYSVTADVVQVAPIPADPDAPIQIGPEEVDSIINYAITTLMVKCGGKELGECFAGMDDFTKAVGMRNRILATKARYLTPLLGQAQSENQQRPNRMEKKEVVA